LLKNFARQLLRGRETRPLSVQLGDTKTWRAEANENESESESKKTHGRLEIHIKLSWFLWIGLESRLYRARGAYVPEQGNRYRSFRSGRRCGHVKKGPDPRSGPRISQEKGIRK